MSARRPGAYARAVEEALARARGRPGLLSPRDWARVADWCARGVPLSLVLEALDEAAARGRRRGTEVRSLAFVVPAVEEAWRAVASGRAVAAAPAGGDLPAWPWQRTAERRAPGDPLGGWLREARVRFQQGAPADVLEAELDRRLPELAGPSALARAASEVDRALAGFRARMTDEAFASTRGRALTAALRRALDLPPLRSPP